MLRGTRAQGGQLPLALAHCSGAETDFVPVRQVLGWAGGGAGGNRKRGLHFARVRLTCRDVFLGWSSRAVMSALSMRGRLLTGLSPAEMGIAGVSGAWWVVLRQEPAVWPSAQGAGKTQRL